MNSQYKKLAYERAALLALVSLAREHLLPPEGEETPIRRVECEELPRSESEVPEDTIIDVVFKLQRLAKSRELEMSKYTHVLAEKNDEQEWEEPKVAQGQAGTKGGAATTGKGKGQGSRSSPQTVAAGGGRQKSSHPANQPAAQPVGGRS